MDMPVGVLTCVSNINFPESYNKVTFYEWKEDYDGYLVPIPGDYECIVVESNMLQGSHFKERYDEYCNKYNVKVPVIIVGYSSLAMNYLEGVPFEFFDLKQLGFDRTFEYLSNRAYALAKDRGTLFFECETNKSLKIKLEELECENNDLVQLNDTYNKQIRELESKEKEVGGQQNYDTLGDELRQKRVQRIINNITQKLRELNPEIYDYEVEIVKPEYNDDILKHFIGEKVSIVVRNDYYVFEL